MKSRLLKNFSVYDLVLIAMLSALTIAFKTVVGVLVRMITGPLGIPGGALAGGFYMMWMPLGIALVGKRGTAFFIALIQTFVLLVTSAPGSHGIWTFITYLIPAVLCELVCLIRFKKGINILHFIFATILANIAGTIGSNLLFFRMPLIPLLFTMAAAALSGVIGGLIGYGIFKKVKQSGLLEVKQIQVVWTDGKDAIPGRFDGQEPTLESISAKMFLDGGKSDAADACDVKKAGTQESGNAATQDAGVAAMQDTGDALQLGFGGEDCHSKDEIEDDALQGKIS